MNIFIMKTRTTLLQKDLQKEKVQIKDRIQRQDYKDNRKNPKGWVGT